ncbi:MAG: DUF4173 domain-containing protein, partial [Planctomycetales bacterium]
TSSSDPAPDSEESNRPPADSDAHDGQQDDPRDEQQDEQSGEFSRPVVRWREFAATVGLAAVCDVTIYHGQGFAGLAVLFFAAPLLLWMGSKQTPRTWIGGLLHVLLIALAVKMIWCGSVLLATVGFALLFARATSLAGLRPHVLQVMLFAAQTIPAGFSGVVDHVRTASRVPCPLNRTNWLNVALPLFALAMFSALFVFANPDLLQWVQEGMRFLDDWFQGWIWDFTPEPLEAAFCVAAFWIAAGALRPIIRRWSSAGRDDRDRDADDQREPRKQEPAFLFPACRNVLISVTILFAAYLAFEFKTLGFREFPEGFYYSGYAHEGAAWLTVALGLSTVMLSLIFRGNVLDDPRLPRLRRLGWLWSLENMLLAVAVYNRLFIYIGFNGLTRMRIVGLFGMTAVVVGFLFVLWKISRNRSFTWLIRNHLAALAAAVFLYAMIPVDAIVVSYNTRRILAGDLAPCVQISVHPISAEGVLFLKPLLQCQDATIREGVRAMLAERHFEAEQLAKRRKALGWTAFQFADAFVLAELRADKSKWAIYAAAARREAALRRFHDYAYRWY